MAGGGRGTATARGVVSERGASNTRNPSSVGVDEEEDSCMECEEGGHNNEEEEARPDSH